MTTAEAPHCLVERHGATLVVTMNRPQARNALTGPMMAIMRDAWDEVDQNGEIRACILTGAGGAFCAGADLKAMSSNHPGDSRGGSDFSVIEGLLKGRRLTKPLIAAVEGPAIAGGIESCRPPISGWRARALALASPNPAGACFRSAVRPSGCPARFPTRWPPICC